MKKEFVIIDTYIKAVSKEIKNRKVKRELRDELLSHLMEIYERNIALGMSDEDAQKDAVSHMGDTEAVAKTFKKLYPVSSFDFLHNNMTNLSAGIAWSLLILIIWSEPLNSIWFVFAYSYLYETLFFCRKANKQFKLAHNTVILNLSFVIIAYFIYNYFALDIAFYNFIIIINCIISCIEYVFIFAGVRELEKRLEVVKKASSTPVISCILLIITQVLVSFFAISKGIWGFIIILFASIIVIFPLIMLADTAELFDAIEISVPKSKKEKRKQFLIKFIIWCLVISLIDGFCFISSTRPAKTTDFVIQDTVTQVNTNEIREDMISLGLPEDIAYDLPDSEVLKYSGAERMEINDDESDFYSADFNHKAYAFYMPEIGSKPQRVRILFVINDFEVYDDLYRDGIYFWQNCDGAFSEFEHSLTSYDGSFCQVLCEIDGETQKIIPFYQRDLMCPDDLMQPIGCDFGFAKNGENYRIYISQTVIPINSKSIIMGLDYYHSDYSYVSTRHSHYIEEVASAFSGFGGSSYDSLRAYFDYNPAYVETEEDNTYSEALQNIMNQFSGDGTIDLSELESAMEEELGQDINSEMLEQIVEEITEEIEDENLLENN